MPQIWNRVSRPAHDKIQSASPPRPFGTFPSLSHISGGFEPKGHSRNFIASQTNTDIWLPSCPKGVLKEWAGKKMLQKLGICRFSRVPMRFLALPSPASVGAGAAAISRAWVPSPHHKLGSEVASKRLKRMENFKGSQTFLSFPRLALYCIFCLLV